MFSIPLISGVQMPGLFGGTMTIPGAGAFIGAVLLAALVGSALGLLRQATSPRPGNTMRRPAIVPPSMDHDEPHRHREAA